MKNTLLLLLFLPLFAYPQSAKTVTVGGYPFVFKTIGLPAESGETEKVEVWRGTQKLLAHTLSLQEGDCNSESVELGTYQTNSATITFYSYWARAGDAPVSPYGVRKQIYQVDEKGHLRFRSGQLYVETGRPGWPENKGIEFLSEAPKSDFERAALATYIKETEAGYGGRFVFGNAQQALFREVRSKLKAPIKRATGNWKEGYANKLGGYKR